MLSAHRRLTPFALAVLLGAAAAHAQNGPNAGALLAIHPDGFRIPVAIAAQPDSGALIVLADTRTGSVDTYVQKVDRHGRPLLGDAGVYIQPFDNTFFALPYMPDGAGGILIVSSPDRGATKKDIVVQRVMPDGSLGYGPNGIVVCSAANDQTQPRLIAGTGGFYYVVWVDARAGLASQFDVYAQRLNLAGTPQWGANGLQVNALAYRPWSYGIQDAVSDQQGGFIVTWSYSGSGGVTRAQRLNSAGAVQFGVTGVDFGDPSYGANSLAADGVGGCWGVYSNWNGSSYHQHAYHLLSNGAAAFAGGVEYTTAVSGIAGTVVVRDNAAGCFIYWLNGGTGPTYSMYRQHISSAGAILADPNYGDYLTSTDRVPIFLDAGTAFYTSSHEFSPGSLRFRQRIQKYSLDGTAQWPGSGTSVMRPDGAYSDPGAVIAMTLGSTGVLMVGWADTRYVIPGALRLQAFGQALSSTGAPLWDDAELPVLQSAKDAPGDQGGLVRAAWNPGASDNPGAAAARGFRVWRALSATATAALAAQRPAHDGVFTAGDRTLLLQASTYWEQVGEESAVTLPGYGLTVPTGLDSVGGNAADQTFMVEAYDDSSHHWFSNTMAGHSVDNLAPAMVPSAAGQYASGTTTLYWGGVSDADLAAYEVYRGSSPAFVPGPANRITSTTNVTWSDPFGGPAFYRIAARDVHGNIGASALVIPNGIVGVDPVAPREWRLTSRYQAGAIEMALDVPHADQGHVELFDVGGRRLWDAPFHTDGAQALAFRATPAALRAGVVYVRATSAAGRVLRAKAVVLP